MDTSVHYNRQFKDWDIESNQFVQAIRGYEQTEREFSKSQCTDGFNCRQTRLIEFGFMEDV
jgi:hypothetical protein